MQKYQNAEIKSFQFSNLESDHVIEQNNSQPFEFQSLNETYEQDSARSEENIREERNFAQRNNFKIDEIVKEYRGLSRQEQQDLEQKIQTEVKRRSDASYEKAYREGLEKGRLDGKEAAQAEFQEVLSQRGEELSQIITFIQESSRKLLEVNRDEIYDFVKRFTKWIILKEIDEKVYLESLLEKLILEINSRKNLIVKVGKANFEQMPEVISFVESRIGQLTNVRVEIVPELSQTGIILESENGLIDGSLEGIFQNIDKIFEQVHPERVTRND